jgi:general stress protein YciG
MSKPFRTLDDADVAGKRVLLRVDLNVPTENGRVTDTTRIERVASTIEEIAAKGGKAHPARPLRPAEGWSGRSQFAEAGRRGGRRHCQAPRRFRDRLHRQGRGRRDRQDEERRHSAAREHPLP